MTRTRTLPRDASQWPKIQSDAIAALPAVLTPPKHNISLKLNATWHDDGKTMRSHQGTIDALAVRLMTQTPDAATHVVLSLANAGEFNRHAFAAIAPHVDAKTTGIAEYMPRLASGVIAAPSAEDRTAYNTVPSMYRFTSRAMLLVGLTPMVMTVHDVLAAVDYLVEQPELQGRRLLVYGRGLGGVAALYAALLDARIHGVVAEDTPSSHADDAAVPGILRHMDIHHAVGLMAPRPIALVNPGHCNWTWAARVFDRLGCEARFVLTSSVTGAMTMMTRHA